MGTIPRSDGAFPQDLRAEVRHAARFAYTLQRLLARLSPEDSRLVWLVGRADEVRALLGCLLEEWSEGRIDAARATATLRSHTRTLHAAIRRRFGSSFELGCCGQRTSPPPPPTPYDALAITARIDLTASTFRPRTDTIPA